MKKISLFLLVGILAACQSASNDIENEPACVGDCQQIIRYSMPNGNDLVLETQNHIIQIEAAPNVKYGYYVWAGDKETTDDPDLIVEDGNTMVLIEE